MSTSTIYSIGHGNKSTGDFLSELRSFGITFLMDVRSRPYSKWNPAFNKADLEILMEKNGFRYVFAGDVLGGMPDDRSCYDEEGKVVYDRIRGKTGFKEGLNRLVTANEKQILLAVMCSESKPHECHRSKLIGQELLKLGVSVNHIVGENKVKSQETVMNELTGGYGTTDLFGNETDFTSRNPH